MVFTFFALGVPIWLLGRISQLWNIKFLKPIVDSLLALLIVVCIVFALLMMYEAF